MPSAAELALRGMKPAQRHLLSPAARTDAHLSAAGPRPQEERPSRLTRALAKGFNDRIGAGTGAARSDQTAAGKGRASLPSQRACKSMAAFIYPGVLPSKENAAAQAGAAAWLS